MAYTENRKVKIKIEEIENGFIVSDESSRKLFVVTRPEIYNGVVQIIEQAFSDKIDTSKPPKKP